MSNSYDIVTVGSGHNGLVAAAYLAAAGKKVLVLERNAWFGGGVVTRALTVPGYLHDQHSMAHIFIQANPLLKNDELKLKAKHGLSYVFPDLPMMSVFEDGTTLGLVSRPREELRGDREVLEEGCRHLSLARDQGRRLSADDRGVAVCAACSARCDVRADGPEPRRPRALALHADELARPALQPVRARQGAHALRARRRREPRLARREGDGHRRVRVRRVPRGLRHRRAGRRLGQAHRRADREHSLARRRGARATPTSRASRVKNGRAAGVETKDGRTFDAKDGVIAALHPHDLGAMVDGVAPEVVKAADDTQISEIGCITLHAALERPAEVPRRRARARRHDRALAEQVRHDSQVVRLPALRRILDAIRSSAWAR